MYDEGDDAMAMFGGTVFVVVCVTIFLVFL